jgi:hypothetical protein
MPGRSRGGQTFFGAKVFDLPGRAETKVAFHCLVGADRPSFEEGIELRGSMRK